jgi:hypothetical protein
MLEACKDYSRVIVKSSSTNWSKFYTIPTFFFNLELIVMALFTVSLNNQWSLDWFRTLVTIGDKQSTIVWQICQVINRGNLAINTNNNLWIVT